MYVCTKDDLSDTKSRRCEYSCISKWRKVIAIFTQNTVYRLLNNLQSRVKQSRCSQ